jgi:hypothetical protein
MRFRNEGIAFAHLTLPPDLFRPEAALLAAKLEEAGSAYSNNALTYLTGQSDLLLELRLTDLRLAFHLDYDSNATGTNWLFAIPFDHAPSPTLDPNNLALRFVIHLRVNRNLYRGKGAVADTEIVTAILQLARGQMTVEVSAGFGWSDLLVSGEFVRRDDFISFLKALHHLRLGADVFQRILTIIGYDTNINFELLHSTEILYPIIFARAMPTHIGRAADVLAWEHGNWRKVVLDGKWDIIITLAGSEGVPAKGFLQHHHQLITSGNLQASGVQRLATHLLAQETTERDGSATPAEPEELASKTCAICASAVRNDDEVLKSAELLPPSLTIAIRNVLNLFRAAAREGNTCCDIVPSLVRCEIGLDRLLRHHRMLHQRMLDVSRIDSALGSPSAARWSPHVVKARHDIEAWCTYAERIVSQRTVGRFEEFLAQNERVVSYRGGIQKLLFLADSLLNSYAQRVYASEEEPALMSLYDPIDLVTSMRVVGFVRIPVRYIFVLPLAISHLWHEVGVHWFYAKYWNPVDQRTRRRALVDFQPLPAEEDASNLERVDLLIDLADVYGDAVTLAKGFRDDLTRFSVSLSSAVFESHAFNSAPPPVQMRFLVQLLVRLYLALEFSQRCAFVRERTRSESMSLSRRELDNWIPDTAIFVAPGIARIAGILRAELLEHERYRGTMITEEIERAAVTAIREVANVVHRRYLSELAWEIASDPVPPITADTESAYERIMLGEITALTAAADVNDLFLLVQQRLVAELRDIPRSSDGTHVGPPSFLQPVAALVRSSLLAFYQRTEGQAKPPRTRVDRDRVRLRNSTPITITERDLLDDEDMNV